MDECRVCGARGEHPRFRAREMMFGRRDEFDYFACGECGCLQIAEVPEDLGEYYPEGYYSFAPPAEGALKRALKRQRARYLLGRPAPLGRVAARWFGVPELFGWIRETGVEPGDAILDVGAGGGHLLLQLRDAGFTNLLGIDPYLDGDRAHPGGVRVLRQGIEKVEGAFDLVMMHHSFEHMPQPREALRHVHRLLKSGRLALIRIPVADSVAWRRYGVDWVQLDAPRHLFLHTVRSMEILAADAGLRLERVVHDSTAFQFWGSEQYRLGVALLDPASYGKRPAASPFTRSQMRAFEREAGELNARGEGDQASFYLRKPRSAAAAGDSDQAATEVQPDTGIVGYGGLIHCYQGTDE